jgi:predicted phosphodiesterase
VRIQIFSDLHADVSKTKPIVIGSDIDVVAVAGDIEEGAENSFVTLRARSGGNSDCFHDGKP